MTLQFTLDEAGALALTEAFLRQSPSYRKQRAFVRWLTPCIILGVLALEGARRGFTPAMPVLALGALLWFAFYPRRFDALVRRQALRQLREMAYAKAFGACTLTVAEDGLHSVSPTGSSHHLWSGVGRIELAPDYLFIFLAGPLGYPIRRSEVGEAAVQAVYADVVACTTADSMQQQVRRG